MTCGTLLAMNTIATFFRSSALALALLAALAPAQAEDAAKPQVYNEQADARADLNQALAQANAQQRNVLVVFGANWCGDCMALDRKFSGGTLAGPIAKRFVVLKVNVGRFDKNTDLAAQMGVPLKKGIPAVAVLGRDGQVLSATSGGELADARNMGDDAVLKVLDGLKR